MAAADSAALLCLRGLACVLSGLVAGVHLTGPALAIPALFRSPHLVPRSRLHIWSRYQADSATLTALLFPLLAAVLASCALLVESAQGRPESGLAPDAIVEWRLPIIALVQQNRKTLFTVAACLIIAIRPYSFGLLAPRFEVLTAEERRILLDRGRTRSRSRLGSTFKSPASSCGWKGASPTQEYAGWLAEQAREGEESDVEDNDDLDAVTDPGGVQDVVKAEPLDTDALILEVTRLQVGTGVLSSAAFVLTVFELLCV